MKEEKHTFCNYQFKQSAVSVANHPKYDKPLQTTSSLHSR